MAKIPNLDPSATLIGSLSGPPVGLSEILKRAGFGSTPAEFSFLSGTKGLGQLKKIVAAHLNRPGILEKVMPGVTAAFKKLPDGAKSIEDLVNKTSSAVARTLQVRAKTGLVLDDKLIKKAEGIAARVIRKPVTSTRAATATATRIEFKTRVHESKLAAAARAPKDFPVSKKPPTPSEVSKFAAGARRTARGVVGKIKQVTGQEAQLESKIRQSLKAAKTALGGSKKAIGKAPGLLTQAGKELEELKKFTGGVSGRSKKAALLASKRVATLEKELARGQALATKAAGPAAAPKTGLAKLFSAHKGTIMPILGLLAGAAVSRKLVTPLFSSLVGQKEPFEVAGEQQIRQLESFQPNPEDAVARALLQQETARANTLEQAAFQSLSFGGQVPGPEEFSTGQGAVPSFRTSID